MAKGRKRKDSAGENVEAYKYETETRKNAVPVGPSSYDTSRPKPIEDKEKVESIYRRVREIIESARSSAYRAVNFAMVQAYWHIGRVVVEEEQRGKTKAGYGEYLLLNLSKRLTADFGKGFDTSNLRYMRLFYLSFENMNSQFLSQEICDALRHISSRKEEGHAVRDELPVVRPELSWTHYRLLLKVDKPDVRRFYIEECIAINWSTRQLGRQINTFYYERGGINESSYSC